MKIHKLAADCQGYTLSYDKSLRTYKAEKPGFNTLYWSKLEFDIMPVYTLVQILLRNDENV